MALIPSAFADRTIAREGDAGRQWIGALPRLVERSLRRWSCTIDGHATHGAVALVVPVVSPRGPAVLKLSFPHPGNVDEPRALQLWDGKGAVRLLAAETEDFALLIERVEHRQLDLDVDEGIIIGAELAATLAVPAPSSIPRLADSADAWAEQLREQDAATGHPFPGRVVDAAFDTIAAIGRDRTPTMIHGDLHAGNILHSDRGWVAIDPKGQAGPLEYDAMTMCLHRHDRMLEADDPVAEFGRRIDLFSEVSGADRSWARRCVQALYDMLQQGSPLEQEWGRVAAAVAQGLAST
jgi:streptomycin 6-kinase